MNTEVKQTTLTMKVPSPIGILHLFSDGESLTGLYTESHRSELPEATEAESPVLILAKQQLDAYFRNELKAFDLPLAPEGTDFQRKVWQELTRIPSGETISYGQLATRMGDPNLSRAVGAANGANPISIIVPCHRVVGSNGKLTGYAGGLDKKQWLLDHESGGTLFD